MKKFENHIVILTPGFAASENDSTTVPAMQVYLKHFIAIYPTIKITVISFQFPFTTTTYNWHGINVIPLNGKNNLLKKIFIWKKVNTVLNQLNCKTPISILHSFWIGECSFIGERFAKKNNIKHIVTAMGQDVYKYNKYAFNLRKSNTKIITLSQNHSDVLLKNHNLNSEIIPWSIDSNNFPDLEENKIDILGVGSLNKIKNYPLFIKIIAELAKEKPNLKVEIIGEGNRYKLLSKLIKKNHLKDTVTLMGKLPRNKVLEKMSESRILLHTSNYESFGFVYAEALYCGMKIVSNNVGFTKSIPEWYICSNFDCFVKSCMEIMDQAEYRKKRIQLNEVKNTLDCYILLYEL